jgi:gamma-glutamyl:cysteine ligase YbdK (ATP-grasp superfamily)
MMSCNLALAHPEKSRMNPRPFQTLLALIIAIAAAAVTAQEPPDPTKLPADAKQSAGTFQVIPYRNSALLVDTRTGQTWTLQTDPEEEPSQVWVPVRKLGTNMEIDQWRQRAKKFREERRKKRMMEEGFDEAIPALPEVGIRGRITPWDPEPIPVHLPAVKRSQ